MPIIATETVSTLAPSPDAVVPRHPCPNWCRIHLHPDPGTTFHLAEVVDVAGVRVSVERFDTRPGHTGQAVVSVQALDAELTPADARELAACLLVAAARVEG